MHDGGPRCGSHDRYVKVSVDGGKTWWLRGSRIDSAVHSGFAYSGLVSLGEAKRGAGSGAGSGAVRLGVVFEPGDQNGVDFAVVQIDVE